VFLAPTKPLVAQQIHASHESCGIPGSDAAELTGENTPAQRIDAVCLVSPTHDAPRTPDEEHNLQLIISVVGNEESVLYDASNFHQ